MDLTIKRNDFHKMISTVSGVAERHILIEAEEKLNISAVGKSDSVMAISGADVNEKGRLCVDMSKLMNFVKSYSGEDLNLKSTKAGWLNIQGESVKIRLPGVGESEYPLTDFTELKNHITLDHNELKNAISMTMYAIGQNEAREGLMGLNLSVTPEKVVFTAGSGPMASRYRIDHKSDFEKDILIPQRTVSEIIKVIENGSKISFSDSNIQVESESCKYKSSLLGATFPNLNSFIDTPSQDTAKINKSDLMSYIDMINSVASAETFPVVKFVFSNGKLEIISQNLDTGQGDGNLDCEYDGPEKSIGVNLNYLKKSISVHNHVEDEEIIFHIAGVREPIGITSESLPNCKSIVMPVTIKW